MGIGERIKQRREALNMTQEELALKMGYKSRSTINKIELGINDIVQSKVIKFAKVLDTSVSYLMGWQDEQPVTDNDYPEQLIPISKVKMRKVPLLGAVACGEPIYREEDEWISLPNDIKADFCLRCEGDSMINAGINDGDIVFIRACPEVENGQIAAVSIDNEVTLKRVYYYPEKNKLVLNPENPAYEPFVYVNEELNDIRILGRAVILLSEIR